MVTSSIKSLSAVERILTRPERVTPELVKIKIIGFLYEFLKDKPRLASEGTSLLISQGFKPQHIKDALDMANVVTVQTIAGKFWRLHANFRD